MLSFESDYTTGAHPEILKRMVETNLEQVPGYGSDPYTERAISKIRDAIQCPQAQIYLAVGGTQTNQLVISTMLADCEGVVAAVTGHVSAHEAGAIEYSGHKVLTVPGHQGKMHADELAAYIARFYADDSYEHMVFPGMVYISQSTEYGSIYSKKELEEIAAVCHQYEIPLYIDGARLAYGVMSHESDVTLADIARIADVFYIGGTKVGALLGEAICFTKNNMPEHFKTVAKQRGALIAKGRLLGIQFDTLFTDGLYMRLGRHAIEMAEKVKKLFRDKGYRMYLDSPTNQQFVILENDFMDSIRDKVGFCFWEKYDEHHTVVRFATSWSTTDADIDYLDSVIPACIS